MDERIKELLDIYERFGKDAKEAMAFALEFAPKVGCGPVEVDLTAVPLALSAKPEYKAVEVDLTAVPLALSGKPEYKAVDLGLPSGRLWADRNVGALRPEDCGLYFSWGNVNGVEQGKACDFSEEAYDKTVGAAIGGDIEAAGGCDAARENMGEPWRMPTEADFVELAKYCNCEWTEQGGCYGMKFTSKKNGNSIFMPASGYGGGRSWYNRGSLGYYWSSTFNSSRNARALFFGSGGVYPQSNVNRYFGFAVRAVQN